MILLIDNYDSFVHNLARYMKRLGQNTRVVRNDEITAAEIKAQKPDAIVMSPGPCAPQQAGCCLEVVRQLHTSIPMLGVCLGHQTITEALGGRTIRANEPVHGRASSMTHDGTGEFRGLPKSFLVGRYHSLVACPKTLPCCLRVTARLDDGTIMAVATREFPVVGWQFHPESVLTDNGYQLLGAFLEQSGLGVAPRESPTVELHRAIPAQPDWFERAIEFPGK